MRIMSYNTLFGGFDGIADQRYQAQIDIIRAADPDILLAQELKGFLDEGGKRLFEMERRLERRALVAPAPVTGQNTAIFVKPDIEILAFESDSVHFHHAAAIARLRVPGLDQPLTAISVHLCPNGTPVRLREVSYLYNHADEDGFAVIGGDFNSLGPDDPDPVGLESLPARYRARYVGPDGKMDRRPITALMQAGFVDVAGHLRRDPEPTVPGAGFANTEFVPFRSDYVFVTPPLARLAIDYAVLRDAATDAASDHYPIQADFLRQS
ncbi:hypothetical protein PX554_25035 [Sphingomonas sp. H39-1-10]|uniref:endonuclease/exonuclease/phosphatase family protein n=1 Tax=Sphingomonas pollutisoli TaxID=3030829 RepID=UPI0023B9A93C|nr:endonuclease/exonuclease/phosphatase family protein [Sphingomonas pollutisoli]MDF0491386.1 hypothetical protein [Sphingomonas pollutisoli]